MNRVCLSKTRKLHELSQHSKCMPSIKNNVAQMIIRKGCLFISISILLLACQKKSQSDFIIPREKFKDILVDIHLIDGFYLANYNAFSFQNDSSNFYTDILKEYGCNLKQFDSTYRYYTHDLKKFDVLYEEVITELNKMQQQSYRLLEMGSDSLRNLYRGKKAWKFPKDGSLQKIPFDIKLKDSANYKITVFLKVFADDQTEDPKLTAYFSYDNGTKEGGKDYFTETAYKVSRRFVVYTFSKNTPNKKVKKLRGFILDHNNKTKSFKKHIEVKGIYISKS